MEKYQNKYRIPSARWQTWDYRWDGAYFITICTGQRKHYFGKIINGKMKLSHIGIIADIMWHEIPNHCSKSELGAFVVMPNHVHGILVINNGDCDDSADSGHALNPQPGQQRFQNIGKNSVSSIIGSYKSAITKHAHRLGFEFQWQTRFHDHVIRNDGEYQRIKNYIESNPSKWGQDKFCKAENDMES